MEQRVEIMNNSVREIVEIISKHNLTYKEMLRVFRYVESEIQDQPIVMNSLNNLP